MNTFIDRKSPDLMDKLANARLYKKIGVVHARPAVAGEMIVTFINGIEETTNTANEGDVVVTGAAGEQYIIGGDKFRSRYTPIASAEDINGNLAYQASGHCRAIRNPFGGPVEILASWGEAQYGDENCYFADACDAEGNGDLEPYIIEGKAFEDTYGLVPVPFTVKGPFIVTNLATGQTHTPNGVKVRER